MEIQQVHQSNEDLITGLIDQYWVSVKKLAFTYVKDWGLAEDVTQEVFIRCYRNLDQYRGEAGYKTWLYKIAINRCKDELKSRWFTFHQIKEKAGKRTASAEQSFLDRQRKKDLSELVLRLPLKYREVIMLHYYEELKMEEIKLLLGMNISTVKTRLRRGKMLLKSMMERSPE
ncbi:sigma-70 family RNA polymerase sigma factor [Metabacillus sp. GX 13764]|uniref:sigma-70 family RNA polymerase sigma factor n=1 Tax=Metabacillus kandeliae TaxID=2900151 RepID=UPI001E585DD1|nr:sigma-70 family RNA polymerase sigma factor [Metabacillus kandeliae]